MICRGAAGHVADDTRGVDWVDLTWPQTLRRALRLNSRAGTRIDVLLPPGGRLAPGDVLSAGPPVIAVRMEEIVVLAIRAADPITHCRLAFELGNRHLPVQITADAIVTPDDGPARGVAMAFGATVDIVRIRFYPEPVTLNVAGSG